MHVLVAPQELKGTLTAIEAMEAMARGLSQVHPDWTVSTLPLADGGPGTVSLVLHAVPGARPRLVDVEDALGRVVPATWAFLPDSRLAVLEMASASGLGRVRPDERSALDASSFGTGQLVKAALDAGARRVVLGVGGSATTDGGLGALAALGVRCFDAHGEVKRPVPRHFTRLTRLDATQHLLRDANATLEVWTDVTNPLHGPDGAARVYAPQKGATADEVRLLEQALAHVDHLAREAGAPDVAAEPGAGAAGGLAWGLAAVLGAKLVPGFAAIAGLVHLDERLKDVQLLLTGEGRFDRQSLFEKGPWAVAGRAYERGVRTVAFVGACDVPEDAWRERLDEVVELGGAVPPDAAVAGAKLEAAVRAWAQREG